MSGLPGSKRLHGDLLRLPSLQPVPTAAERAADLIREHIFRGEFMPGTPLPEIALAQALQISRNTVRDALRTLVHEHLVTYEVNKGVSVRYLTADDVRDIYALRRLLELAALALIKEGATLDTEAFEAILSAQERAAEEGRWRDVGTQNLRFHAQIVTTHRSVRADGLFRELMTEMRLGFLGAPDPQTLHEPYMRWNRKIYDLLRNNRHDEAHTSLAEYLKVAEREVLDLM
jgi:DNA-binding GntR family transcriptional regulator